MHEKSGVVFAHDQDPPLALISTKRVCFRPETKKPPWRAVFRWYSELALFVPGNGFIAGSRYPNTFPSLAPSAPINQVFLLKRRYRRPPPLALCRTRTDWKHEFVAVCGCGWSGRTGKSHILPSVRSRTTAAHDSQPWGICKQSVTGNQPRPALKKRRGSLAIRWRLKQMQQGRGVSLERVRGSCRKQSR